MASTHPHITPELLAFIAAQPMFFVGTAPLSLSGHVNISPKGLDTFRVLSPTCVAYLDLTGSGNETAAHTLENARITFMFCSFADPPKILRLYGKGRLVLPDDAEWNEYSAHFPALAGTRQIVIADLSRVQTSCGFGIPLMQMAEPRNMLTQWAEKKGSDALRDYRRAKNSTSIDGLPTGLPEE